MWGWWLEILTSELQRVRFMWDMILCCWGSGFRDFRVQGEGTVVFKTSETTTSVTASHPRWHESVYKACLSCCCFIFYAWTPLLCRSLIISNWQIIFVGIIVMGCELVGIKIIYKVNRLFIVAVKHSNSIFSVSFLYFIGYIFWSFLIIIRPSYRNLRYILHKLHCMCLMFL